MRSRGIMCRVFQAVNWCQTCDYGDNKHLWRTQSCLNIDPQQLTTAVAFLIAIYRQHSKSKQMAAQTDSLRKFAVLATKAKMHAKAEELWQRLVDANNGTARRATTSRTPNQLWEN